MRLDAIPLSSFLHALPFLQKVITQGVNTGRHKFDYQLSMFENTVALYHAQARLSPLPTPRNHIALDFQGREYTYQEWVNARPTGQAPRALGVLAGRNLSTGNWSATPVKLIYFLNC